MIQAVYKDTVIAQSEKTIFLEGNHYFPAEEVETKYLIPNNHRTTCPWKGQSQYYDISVSDKTPNAAWHYPEPKEAASDIKGHIAFDTSIIEVKDLSE